MNRSRAAQFADIAVELHEEPDLDHTIGRVVDYARDVMASDDAGLMLLRGRRRIETAGATDPTVEKSDLLQKDTGEGPGLRAIEGPGTLVEDTRADHRWPRWSGQVAELGLRSVMSVRLSTSDATLGSLNLYAKQPRSFDDDDLAVAHTFALHASLALATAHEEDGLRQAVDAENVIGQAQGILMERFGLDADRSFAVLRRYSRDNNVKLRVVAQAMIDTRRLPD